MAVAVDSHFGLFANIMLIHSFTFAEAVVLCSFLWFGSLLLAIIMDFKNHQIPKNFQMNLQSYLNKFINFYYSTSRQHFINQL